MSVKFGAYHHIPLATRQKYNELETLNRQIRSDLGIKSSNVWDSPDGSNPGDYLSITGKEYEVLYGLTTQTDPIKKLVATFLREKGVLRGIGVDPKDN